MTSEAPQRVPMYRMIARSLEDRIENGELPPSSQIPTERELASEYGVSLMTARAAVNTLAQRGLVERKARSGTFVARRKIQLDLSAVAGLSVRLLRRGVAPGAEVIEACTVRVGELEAIVGKALELSENDSVHVIVRRRTGDGEPIALEKSYFPSRYYPDLLDQDLTGSIYELLHSKYGLEPTRLHQEVEVTQLDASAALKFGVRPDVPVLRVTRIAWDVKHRPVEFARDLFRGDRLVFVSDTDQTPNEEKGRAAEA